MYRRIRNRCNFAYLFVIVKAVNHRVVAFSAQWEQNSKLNWLVSINVNANVRARASMLAKIGTDLQLYHDSRTSTPNNIQITIDRRRRRRAFLLSHTDKFYFSLVPSSVFVVGLFYIKFLLFIECLWVYSRELMAKSGEEKSAEREEDDQTGRKCAQTETRFFVWLVHSDAVACACFPSSSLAFELNRCIFMIIIDVLVPPSLHIAIVGRLRVIGEQHTNTHNIGNTQIFNKT